MKMAKARKKISSGNILRERERNEDTAGQKYRNIMARQCQQWRLKARRAGG